MQHKVIPNLWSDNQAEEAAAACCTSVFPHSRVVNVLHGVPAG
jgi:predicted 3-demethylubiquinone-9 3-methyltransferase (glyoxalase superfamily)